MNRKKDPFWPTFIGMVSLIVIVLIFIVEKG